jgi:hypothetical protein
MRDPWDSLTELSDTYTCYSSAVATWKALEDGDWTTAVNPGLWLTLTEAGGGLFGFGHFPPRLRGELGLRRTGAGTAQEARDGVLAELSRSGRVIVAGDGFNLPWHVARGRVHVPHWYVLTDGAGGPAVLDPFACRNELGVQSATRETLDPRALASWLAGLPGDDPVLGLRERFALGDDAGAPGPAPYQWYVHEPVAELREPEGLSGPDALLRLSAHFREGGQNTAAYDQADDIWSIARHRAFLATVAERDGQRDRSTELADWVTEHAAPLAKRWAHMAPLMMQARLALGAGRPASASVPDRLQELAERERAAAAAAPPGASSPAPPA